MPKPGGIVYGDANFAQNEILDYNQMMNIELEQAAEKIHQQIQIDKAAIVGGGGGAVKKKIIENQLKPAIEGLKSTHKILYLIRGIPGSGKSTLAQLISMATGRVGFAAYIFEADTFFIHPDGSYKFDPALLESAHSSCQENARRVMEGSSGVVIVSNTFVFRAHMEPYIKFARQYDYKVVEYVCRGNFENVHGVPSEVVRRMRQNFEN